MEDEEDTIGEKIAENEVVLLVSIYFPIVNKVGLTFFLNLGIYICKYFRLAIILTNTFSLIYRNMCLLFSGKC